MLRDQTGTEVATVLQRHRRGDQTGGREERECEHPPPFVGVGTDRLGPSDRGCPRQHPVADVPDRSEDERQAEHGATQRQRRPRPARHLCDHRRDPGVHDARSEDRHAEGE